MAAAPAGAELGKPAPDFTLTSFEGAAVTLSSLKGKIVVLEWFNPGCPFVQGAHGTGGLKDLAAKYKDKNVVFVAINSSAPGKEGAAPEANAKAKVDWKMDYAIHPDADGKVGHLYGAVKTPHLFVVDAAGVLVYKGGLDSTEGGEIDAGTVVTNYIANALEDLIAGRPVATPETQAWGCGVKYAQ